MKRAGSGQPASPMTFAGTPATVFCPGADHHPATDFRMAVAVLLAGPPEGDAVEHGNIVLDDGGLADDEAGGVVEEDAPPDPGGGMNVGLERRGGAALV